MYGQRVHQAVLDNQETETGATIHVVDEEYDHGRTLATAIVKIEPSDDLVSLEQRVMSAEWTFSPTSYDASPKVKCGCLSKRAYLSQGESQPPSPCGQRLSASCPGFVSP